MANPKMSSGTALRQLQQAQAGMKKARQALTQVRGDTDPDRLGGVLRLGWESLRQCHRLLAEIPLEAASEDVLTRQLAVQRYATALLVRLRRIARNDPDAIDAEGADDFDDEI